jgi:hypothetical protein
MTTIHTAKRMLFGGLLSGGIALAGLGLTAGTAQAFNPQPEPPGKPLPAGTIQGFNPQPDPPGIIRVFTPGSNAPGKHTTAGVDGSV